MHHIFIQSTISDLILLCLLNQRDDAPLLVPHEGGHHQPLVPVLPQLRLGATRLPLVLGQLPYKRFQLYEQLSS